MAKVTKIEDNYSIKLTEREYSIVANSLIEFTNGQFAPNAMQWSLLEDNVGMAPHAEVRALVKTLTMAAQAQRTS